MGRSTGRIFIIGESVFSCSAVGRLPSIGLRGYLSFHVKSNDRRASGGESAAPGTAAMYPESGARNLRALLVQRRASQAIWLALGLEDGRTAVPFERLRADRRSEDHGEQAFCSSDKNCRSHVLHRAGGLHRDRDSELDFSRQGMLQRQNLMRVCPKREPDPFSKFVVRLRSCRDHG